LSRRYAAADSFFKLQQYRQFASLLALCLEAYNQVMSNSKYIHASVTLAFAALLLSNGIGPQRAEATRGRQQSNIIAKDNLLFAEVKDDAQPLEATPEAPELVSDNSTFYTVRADLRRCISPMCGGYFVKRVNLPTTRCANGSYMAQCYVAAIDWKGQHEVEAGRALLRGNVIAKPYERFGNLGEFVVLESWQAVTDSQPEGTFYRVRDRGLRCITHPCPTHQEAKLNSIFSLNIAGVDLSGAGLGNNTQAAEAAMREPAGVMISGNNVPVTGPGGRSLTLKAMQVYLRDSPGVSNLKPCMKTGCSRAICADHNVISTCEWRPEYACYQKATCARQADGNCGFTETRQLTSCLAARGARAMFDLRSNSIESFFHSQSR
jgi:hypothetical protein